MCEYALKMVSVCTNSRSISRFQNKFRKCFWKCLEQTCEIFKCVPKVFIRGFFKECISEYWKPPKNVQIARNTLNNNNNKFNQVLSHETKHFARIHGSWSIFTLPNYNYDENKKYFTFSEAPRGDSVSHCVSW